MLETKKTLELREATAFVRDFQSLTLGLRALNPVGFSLLMLLCCPGYH